jgi:hypothetical protein
MIDAELRDATRPICARFSWWGIDLPRTMPLMEVTLEFRNSIRATAIVENPRIADPLLRFLSEVGTLPDNWDGEKRFLSSDENLRISCCQCRRGMIYLDVSLDADREDPIWTVELRMEIRQSAWPEIIRQFRNYFAAVEGEV